MGRSPTLQPRGAPKRPAPPRRVDESDSVHGVTTSPWESASPSRMTSRISAGLVNVVRALALALVVASALLLAVVSIGPRLGLFRIETVLSGSMRPAFAPGDLVIVTPEPTSAVREGQIITYQIPIGDHHVETHRVIRAWQQDGARIVITKGDANTSSDPWKAALSPPTAWHVRWVIPHAGRAIIWLRAPLLRHIAILGAPFILALLWLHAIWRPRRRPERA